jgi:hypothetical protein
MTHPIAILKHEEAVRFDADRLETLCKEYGEAEAEQVIARALEQVAHKMAAVEALYHAGRLQELDRLCASLTMVAGQIGMTTMARVSRDVRACVAGGNPASLAATLRRLQRIGDNSVHAIWSLEDISV